MSVLGSLVSGAFGLIGQNMQYQQNMNLARMQNKFNVDMWKMQADYNSPQQQMERFKKAGLNPYLVASQGNAGNMSSAPEQVVPSAPDYSKSMRELGEAFNIEGLRQTIANRKQAEEAAKQAHLETLNKRDERWALRRLQNSYEYDLKTGKYVPRPDGVIQTTGLAQHELPTDLALLNQYFAKYDPRIQLLSQQRAYLAPQISMANYEAQHYPITYWVGTAGKGVKAVSDLTGIFNPSRYLMPISRQTRGFVTPSGRVLNY